MNDREDAKVLAEALALRLELGEQAERVCQLAMDTSLAEPRRWSIAYTLKSALRMIGTAPAHY